MHGFVPHEGRKKKGKASTRKGKRTAVHDVSIDLDDFFDFKLPSVEGSSTEVPEFAEASRSALLKVRRALGTSRQEARMAHFRTDMAEKEIARLKSELDNRREGEPCEADVRRAYRRGRRDVAKIVRTRRERFSHEFGELQANHKVLGLPRVSWHCGGLYLTTAHDYSYDIEYARQSRRMNERIRDFAIPQIERRIWEQWSPIPVSFDTVDAEAGVPNEMGEVDQPAPQIANDKSFGRSMTGVFDLGD
ncbi:hypothetical protein Bca4012_037783 [Brassica carinata]